MTSVQLTTSANKGRRRKQLEIYLFHFGPILISVPVGHKAKTPTRDEFCTEMKHFKSQHFACKVKPTC